MIDNRALSIETANLQVIDI